MAGEMVYVGDDTEILGDDDYLGDDEILGADEASALQEILGDDDYLGADRRRRRSRGAALAAARARGGVVVQRNNPTRVKKQPLPIPPTAFNAGQSIDITLQPQRTIRVERPVFGSSIAAFFALNDVKINQNSQFVGPGSIPCECFTEVAEGIELKGDTASPGSLIVLSVENIDTAAHTLRGTLIGTVVM